MPHAHETLKGSLDDESTRTKSGSVVRETWTTSRTGGRMSSPEKVTLIPLYEPLLHEVSVESR